ncbi:MAG: hypothetical protein M1822_000712 [Bathelium mastoideum]|nr:MAG: hypothetical protein M1822_000712 [Bathelium mastoideum]
MDKFYGLHASPPRLFLIGPEKAPFYVAPSALSKCSPFYERILNGPFNEAQSAEPISLPEDHVAAWKLLLYWLGHDELPSNDLISASGAVFKDFELFNSVFKDLGCLWLHADKINHPQLANKTMDSICALLRNSRKESVSDAHLKYFLRQTLPGSPFWNLLVDIVAIYMMARMGDVKDFSEFFAIRDFGQRVAQIFVDKCSSRRKHVRVSEQFGGSCYHVPSTAPSHVQSLKSGVSD